MEIQKFWNPITEFFNICAVYYTMQLVRCVLCSYIVVAVVFLLRKTVFKNNVFLKSALWSLFLPVLFVGKLKLYYENSTGILLFTWWTGSLIKHMWICWLYLCGVLAYAVRLMRRRKRIKTFMVGMEKRTVEGTEVFITKMPVTPSVIGVFCPKIIIPEVIVKEYDREALHTILLHEKNHIWLGHLLFSFLWDMLCVMLWLNPLLTIGTKYFHEDMEEVCDWVTIQKSGGKPYVYGQLLLKSMRVLQVESQDFNMFVTFAGDKEYQNIRQRVIKIAKYRPYRRIVAAGIFAAAALCITAIIVSIQINSYSRCNPNDVILVYEYNTKDSQSRILDSSEKLHNIISYNEKYVYIDREQFENLLHKTGAVGEIYIVFGGFYKLPGFIGRGYSCCYQPVTEEKIIQIPYEKPKENWIITMMKWL